MCRLRQLVFVTIASLSMNACYSYALLMRLNARNTGTARFTESNTAQAVESLSKVAREFSLTASPNLESFQRAWAPHDRVLAVYGREPDRENDRSQVLLVVGIDNTNGMFFVLLRDWAHVEPTRFAVALKEALVSSLTTSFPSDRIEIQQVRDVPIWYVP
jgi:hypothetical protein